MNMDQEQIDFFHELGLKIDWRGAIYGKAKSDSETACGTSKGSGKASEEAEVKEN